jgi:hypothetical protein
MQHSDKKLQEASLRRGDEYNLIASSPLLPTLVE